MKTESEAGILPNVLKTRSLGRNTAGQFSSRIGAAERALFCYALANIDEFSHARAFFLEVMIYSHSKCALKWFMDETYLRHQLTWFERLLFSLDL